MSQPIIKIGNQLITVGNPAHRNFHVICGGCKEKAFILYGSEWRCGCGQANTVSETLDLTANNQLREKK